MTSWYNSAYKERAPIAINNNAGAGSPPASPTTIDWELTVPPTWTRFWDNILVSAFDVVLTDVDNNLLQFQRSTYIHASKRLVIQVNNMTAYNNTMSAAWIYWNNPTATDAASSFTAGAMQPALLFLGAPSGRLVETLADRPASDTPPTVFTKTSIETIWIWFRVSNLMGGRIDAYQKRTFFESIRYCNVVSYDSSGTASAGRVVPAATRFINGFIGVQITGGSNGTDYTVSLEMRTTEDQIITPRCLVQVRDMLPPA
jgi:hypothetical protein